MKTPFGQFETPPPGGRKAPGEKPETGKKAPSEKPTPPAAPREVPEKDIQTVRDKFEETKKEKTDAMDHAFETAISAGGKDASGRDILDERALSRLRGLKEKKIQDIAALFSEERLQELVKDAAKGGASFDTLVDKHLEMSKSTAERSILAMQTIITHETAKTGEKFITTAAAAEIEKAMLGVEALARENKKVQEVFTKMTEGRELDDKDYGYVVSILNPYDITKQRTDVQSTFEAGSAGALIGLMRPDQRYRLVETFMASNKKAQTAGLIDGFLKTGVLTRYQGEALFEEAIKKGAMTREQFTRDFKSKLDQGLYEKEVAEFKKIIEEERSRDYSGQFSDNIMNRISERPLAGGILALWGLITVTLNLVANRFGKESLNVWTGAGTAAILAGTEIATGTVKKGTDWFGAGVIGRGIESVTEPADAAQKKVEKNAREKISDIMMNAPKELVAYLDNGGFATVWALRTEKINKQEKPIITVDELLNAEKNPQQIQRLQALKGMSFVSEQSVNEKLTFVGEAAFVLDVQNNEGFTKLVMELRDAQKPQGATAAAPAGPAAKGAAAEKPSATSPKPPVKTPFKT